MVEMPKYSTIKNYQAQLEISMKFLLNFISQVRIPDFRP